MVIEDELLFKTIKLIQELTQTGRIFWKWDFAEQRFATKIDMPNLPVLYFDIQEIVKPLPPIMYRIAFSSYGRESKAETPKNGEVGKLYELIVAKANDNYLKSLEGFNKLFQIQESKITQEENPTDATIFERIKNFLSGAD